MRLFLLSALLLAALHVPVQAGTILDFNTVEEWRAEPGWVGGPARRYSASARQGIARFAIEEPGRRMKWRTAIQPFNPRETGCLVLRYRAGSLGPAQDYLFWVFDSRAEGRLLLPRQAIRDDGEWHLLAMDVWSLEVTGSIQSLALHLEAADRTPAWIEIDYLRYETEPPARSDRYPEESSGAMEWAEEFDWAACWQANPGWLANPDSSASAQVVRGSLRLAVPSAGKGMKWSRSYPEGVVLRNARYAVIRYRARNVSPQGDYFIWLGSEDRGAPQQFRNLMPLGLVEDDGAWHTHIAPVRATFTLAEMAVQAQAEDPNSRIEIDYIRFTSRRPLVALEDNLPYTGGHATSRLQIGQFAPVALKTSASIHPYLKTMGLRNWFSGSQVTVEGIPFRLNQDSSNIVPTPQGESVPATVPVGRSAREAYLLMASILPPEDFSGILGGRPLPKISDPERFTARVRYSDGSEDRCFPIRVRTGEYEVVSGVEVYCLSALRPLPIRDIALECHMASGQMLLAGLTLHTGRPIVRPPHIAALPPPVPERPVPSRKGRVEIRGSRIVLATSTLKAVFSAERGISLVSLTNLCLRGGRTRLTLGSFFEVGEGEKVIPSARLKVGRLRREENAAVMDIDARPEAPIAGTLRLSAQNNGEIGMTLRVRNASDRTVAPLINFPVFSRVALGGAGDTWYLHARQGGIINRVPTVQRQPYSGRYPLQVMGLFNPRLGGGLYLLIKDRRDIYKYFVTDKNERGVDWRIEYFPRQYRPGEVIETAETALSGHTGDWRAELAAYRKWVSTWYKPLAPRKKWFRDVYNYRQHLVRGDLYDFQTGRYRMEDVVRQDRAFFGRLDYLHIFDFGQSDTYGRVGDYSHYGEIGGRVKLAGAIAGAKRLGVSVGVYIEGYLCDERGVWGRNHVAEGHIIRSDGSPLLWDGAPMEHMMCPDSPAWRSYLPSIYRRVARELSPSGMYIDQHGFGDEWKICRSLRHGHPVPWPPIRGERDLGRLIRKAVPPAIATLTEETPTDVNSQGQDGALSYSVANSDPALSPHRADLFRFLFPDFKVIQLVSYNDFTDGGWSLLKYPFFNAEGWWLGNALPAGFEPAAQRFLKKAFAVLHAHADAFRSDRSRPLIPTLHPLVYANAFPGKKETAWTLLNGDCRTYRGPALAVPHMKGAIYRDAWRGTALKPVIRGSRAILHAEIGPREVGCIVQTRTPGR
ncbi:MAG: hypothetical protein IT210_25050 [Armatimonadetes bacterium]|nr:hypothetical protein [Armatimonadota bacterium]